MAEAMRVWRAHLPRPRRAAAVSVSAVTSRLEQALALAPEAVAGNAAAVLPSGLRRALERAGVDAAGALPGPPIFEACALELSFAANIGEHALEEARKGADLTLYVPAPPRLLERLLGRAARLAGRRPSAHRRRHISIIVARGEPPRLSIDGIDINRS